MNQREFLTAIGCCLLLAGCGQQLVRDAQESPTSRREASKNYVLGQERSAYVGDAIARVKDYLVTVSTSQIAVPSENVTVGGAGASITLEKGRSYPIVGHATVDGITFAVAEALVSTGVKGGVLFDSTGEIYHRVVVLGRPGIYVPVAFTMTVVPPTTRMIRGQDEKIDTRAGYTNFEIILSLRRESTDQTACTAADALAS